MRPVAAAFCAAALAFASVASSHAHLQSSVPANHSTLSAAPPSITLQFQEPVQLTALSIQQGSAKPQKLGPLPSNVSAAFAVALPALGAGSYVITWRAVSDDGHVMSDRISFTIGPTAAPAAK